MKPCSDISIPLDRVEQGLQLIISATQEKSLYDASDSDDLNNEAPYQLLEGCFYDYELSNEDYVLGTIGENIVIPHSRRKNFGRIAPNIFVGTLTIPIQEKETGATCGEIQLEVQSVKASYREDYRDMLEFITEKCTDLLLQSNSPVSHYFDIDYAKDAQTLYQKFAFLKSIISSSEFKDAVHRIVTSPATTWSEVTEQKDIRSVRRFSSVNVKELAKGSKRTRLPESHYLTKSGLVSIPERITAVRKIDSVDTPENRFIKHALETFLKVCTDINNAAAKDSVLWKESNTTINELESQLHHSFFNDISRPTTLKLNSPILQRKEGYREILRSWLMFDLAAKLVWSGGEDVYGAGKKDIATLYEYWLFFKLLDLFKEVFEIEPKDIANLIEPSDNNLNLRLKQGKFTALRGVYQAPSRKLHIRFNYNRSFSGGTRYPGNGSWTTTMRPDYTLSFWPYGISEKEAEHQELITHIHFDAKYKIANLKDFLQDNFEDDLDTQKTDNRKGIYKNADILKMHAYKDAIRRTGGAYVLYPGDKNLNRKGFHEIIPGLGAFPVRPSKNDSGINELKTFIKEVIAHFLNRTSQREKIAFRTYDIFKSKPGISDTLEESLPETYGENRSLLPDETYVLIGYCKSMDHFNWIKDKLLYNFRTNNNRGALKLTKETLSAKYLLLHMQGDDKSSRIFKIEKPEFRVTPKNTLSRLGYPVPRQSSYLVVKLEECKDKELQNISWNFKKLKNYRSGRASAIPFTASLLELMKVKVH